MLHNALESGLVRTLVRRADTRVFPMVVGAVAVAAPPLPRSNPSETPS